MLEVLIVDDELLLRTNLKVIIDWEANRFNICGEASNGLEALKIIEGVRPDIVISDIRMPVMDGLQLMEKAKSEYPDIEFIMLSNYDDFEYVREALKNGAIDYILKHNLNKTVLSDALGRAKALIDGRNSDRKKNSVESLTSNNLIAIKGKFIVQLLTGFYKKESEICDHLTLLDMKIDTRNVVAILMVIDDYKLPAANGSLKDSSLLEFAVINISEEILNEFGNGVIGHLSNEKFVLLLSFANKHSSALIENTINSVLSRIALCLKRFMNISVSFCIGSNCECITEIAQSYETAEKLLSEKFFCGKSSVLKSPYSRPKKKLMMGISIEVEKQITSKIREKDEEALVGKLISVFDSIEKDKLSIKSSKMIFHDLLGILNRICKENCFELTSIYTGYEAPDELLFGMETLDDAKEWFLKAFRKLMELMNSGDRELNSQYVKRTMNFIKTHYTENISLGQAADEMNVSSAYLSRIFKEEVGIGFSEYLCDLRINKAKSLFEEGREDIKDVAAMCGFNNYAYFFNVFKKKLGVTPKEFLNTKANRF